MDNKFIITVKRIENNKDWELAQFEVPDDSDLADWKYIFSAILAFISFNPEQIKELFEGSDSDEKTNYN